MASSLRIGTSALRSSIAKPVQSAALNGARCYSSAKVKVGGSFLKLQLPEANLFINSLVPQGYLRRQPARPDREGQEASQVRDVVSNWHNK